MGQKSCYACTCNMAIWASEENVGWWSGLEWIPHIGPKSLILAPQDIPDISGYQFGFGCQCVKAYNNENPVKNQKIL